MCGRYRLARNIYELMEFFGVEESDLNWEPHYNIAPTQDVVTVCQHSKEPRRAPPLLQGYFCRRKSDQCRIRDGGREAYVSRSNPEAALPHTSRRILRMEETQRQREAAI